MKDGGSAFPYPLSNDTFSKYANGMTLRDWFAGQALAGWVSDPSFTPSCNYNNTAMECYKIADAMLKARETASA